MDQASTRVDDYIAAMPAWAQPMANTLRATILNADPALAEVWKWNGPCYERDGLVCGFDSAKAFISITFFRGGEMADGAQAFNHCVDNQHNRSIRFEPGAAIDTGLIERYVREAVALNLAGPKKAMKSAEPSLPDELAILLIEHDDAKAVFDAFPPYKRKDYIEWIATAKRPETRAQRLAKTLQNLKAGLGLNDKYTP